MTLKFNTSAPPQIDGQSERAIQILEGILRACVLYFDDKWMDCLPYAELAYNNYTRQLGWNRMKLYIGRNAKYRYIRDGPRT
jgi:hypothetical protein